MLREPPAGVTTEIPAASPLCGHDLASTLCSGLSAAPSPTMTIDPSSRQPEPGAEYRRRLESLRAAAAQYAKRDATLGNAKLLALIGTVIAAVWILAVKAAAIYWIAPAAALLAYLSFLHERVIRAARREARVIAFYEGGLARVEHRWAGKGETGERFADPSHPYSRDLDLFGKGSLFELLCTARTRAGEETLAHWLLFPALPQEVYSRHAAIEELRGRLDLREELAITGEDVRSGVRPEALAKWGEEPPLLQPGALRFALPFLAALWLCGWAVWAIWDVRSFLLLASLVNLGVAYQFRERIGKSVVSLEEAARDLKLLSQVLARLEGETFSAPRLLGLQTRLRQNGVLASRSIARLSKLVQWLESRRNPIIKSLDPFIFWSFQCSFAVEAWRTRFGPAVRDWIAALGELEALSDLGGYAYEHPGDVFPEFTAEAPRFEAEGLAHPLIPEERAVRNDLLLGKTLRMIIISGSNMAGKSTLIRAAGVNAVLAQCGAPVRARKLCLSALAVAASVCILDSLQDGISRFYAEIIRLKLITDLARGPTPVLVLLDELLQGTNSHDRRIGAEAVVRSLFAHGALGLVSTHDLALAEIADPLGPAAANVHFADHVENGKLHFDYRMTPGTVETSNALELMRSIGLDV